MLKGFLILTMCYFALEAGVFLLSIIEEHRALTRGVIRLHVVADSDEAEAQRLKLRVRDRITGYLSREMGQVTDRREAERFLAAHMPEIRETAREALRQEGCGDGLEASLRWEKFPKRVYDTFSLPAGRYEALRITIGQGKGHNWWCVVFPALCIPASSRGFEDCAEASGMDETTIRALEGKEEYEVRFGLMDLIGHIGNLFP